MGGGMRIPNAGGFGGGISGPEQDPLAVVEQLAKQRDAGEITEAQFEAQKKRLLG
jgi:Short C-terminal domain